MRERHGLAPDMRQAIELAKAATLSRKRTEASDEIRSERGARCEAALGVLVQLPTWAQRCPWDALVDKLDVVLCQQADHWGMGSPNLVILAPTGAGKTRTLSAIVRRLLRIGARNGGPAWDFASGIVVSHAAELALARRNHPLGRGEAPEVTQAIEASLLVVDDLGWDRDPTTLRDILEQRYRRNRPLIAASGMTKPELTVHYGAAVLRRIRERDGQKEPPIDLHPKQEPEPQ